MPVFSFFRTKRSSVAYRCFCSSFSFSFFFFFDLSSFTIAVSVAVTMQVFYIPLSVALFISLYHVLCNF